MFWHETDFIPDILTSSWSHFILNIQTLFKNNDQPVHYLSSLNNEICIISPAETWITVEL